MEKNKLNKISQIQTEEKPKTNLAKKESLLKIPKTQKIGLYSGFLIVVIAGVISGYFLSQSKGSMTGIISGKSDIFETKKIVGSTDTKIFKDSAEGILEKGGINGEGTHKLIRPGGESQTVYLTSSVINLNDFVGKKVKVWGETQAAQKAGWFMDVGRLEVL